MRYILTLLLSLSCCVVMAQSDIMESLTSDRPGEGRVTIRQSRLITSLIGRPSAGHGAILKGRGYRVQVYAGGNSRAARDYARSLAREVKEKFPQLEVYAFFKPPRWLCRVGDFRNIEEADAVMRALRAEGNFKEVSIVREQINIPLD